MFLFWFWASNLFRNTQGVQNRNGNLNILHMPHGMTQKQTITAAVEDYFPFAFALNNAKVKIWPLLFSCSSWKWRELAQDWVILLLLWRSRTSWFVLAQQTADWSLWSPGFLSPRSWEHPFLQQERTSFFNLPGIVELSSREMVNQKPAGGCAQRVQHSNTHL